MKYLLLLVLLVGCKPNEQDFIALEIKVALLNAKIGVLDTVINRQHEQIILLAKKNCQQDSILNLRKESWVGRLIGTGIKYAK